MKKIVLVFILGIIYGFSGYAIGVLRYSPCYLTAQFFDRQDKIIDQLIEKYEKPAAPEWAFRLLSSEDDFSEKLAEAAELGKKTRIYADACLGTR